jgi:hypothetical protein
VVAISELVDIMAVSSTKVSRVVLIDCGRSAVYIYYRESGKEYCLERRLL